MVTSCAAYGCTNRVNKPKNMSFYSFPKNKVLLKKWLIAVRRKNFKPGAHAKLCAEHFHPDDFVHNFGRTTLKCDAVPSLFVFTKKSIAKPIKLRSQRLYNSSNGAEPSFPSNRDDIADRNHDITKSKVDNGKEIVVSDTEDVVNTTPAANLLSDNSANEVVVDHDYISKCKMVIVKSFVEKSEKTDESLTSSPEFILVTGSSTSPSGSIVDRNHISKCELDFSQQTVVENTDVILSTSETNLPTGRRRRRSVPAFMGDVEPRDLEDPKKFKIMWKIAKDTVYRQKHTIKYLRTKLRRANQKIDAQQGILNHLFE